MSWSVPSVLRTVNDDERVRRVPLLEVVGPAETVEAEVEREEEVEVAVEVVEVGFDDFPEEREVFF